MTNPCCESSDLSRKWPFPNTQLAPPEPVAWTERSHQVSSQTHLPDSPALAELGGLENLLHLRGEYGSRQRSLPPRSQLEVDTLRRQIRRIHRALENSPPPAQSRFPLVINDLEPNEQLIRHGRARPLTSPALPRLQSDIDNRRQFPNQNNVEEPKSRVSALHPQYLDLPPPINRSEPQGKGPYYSDRKWRWRSVLDFICTTGRELCSSESRSDIASY